MKLQVEYIPIDSIKTYEGNAKLHPAEQVEQIKKSIQDFGMNDPIAVWKDNVIIEGHGRLIALKELGYTEAPVIRLDNLSDEERRAYALAHNKLTMNTGFDFNLLDMELEDLSFDMGEFGFDVSGEDFGGDIEPDLSAQPSFKYKEQYGVIVMCESEQDQEAIYNRLTEEGYNCRVVAV